MGIGRLLRLRHDRQDIGFLSARIVRDEGYAAAWMLHVESPGDLDEFRGHLADGSCMTLTMVTRAGDHYRGEACVASVSDSIDSASIVTLTGMGPLHTA